MPSMRDADRRNAYGSFAFACTPYPLDCWLDVYLQRGIASFGSDSAHSRHFGMLGQKKVKSEPMFLRPQLESHLPE